MSLLVKYHIKNYYSYDVFFRLKVNLLFILNWGCRKTSEFKIMFGQQAYQIFFFKSDLTECLHYCLQVVELDSLVQTSQTYLLELLW